MPLQAYALCSYHTDRAFKETGKRTQAQWDAHMLCLAVKRRAMNGFIDGEFSGHRLRINGATVERARKFFGGFVRYASGMVAPADYVVVPVPSKDSFNVPAYRSLLMVIEAMGVADRDRVINSLRFIQDMVPAHEGGLRGFRHIYPRMESTANLAGRKVILVDDLITGGGTVLAAKARVEEAGGRVLAAVACGRTDDFAADPCNAVSWIIDDPIW